jgi:hypothetical protein
MVDNLMGDRVDIEEMSDPELAQLKAEYDRLFFTARNLYWSYDGTFQDAEEIWSEYRWRQSGRWNYA